MRPSGHATEAWSLPDWAAAVVATAPTEGGGVFLRGPSGPEIDAWMELARGASDCPWTSVGPSVTLDHLTGALDIEASVATGAVKWREGILDRAAGSVVEVRWPALLSIDRAHALARSRSESGLVVFQPTTLGEEAEVWAGLVDPLALWLVVPGRWTPSASPDDLGGAVRDARPRWRDVTMARDRKVGALAAAERLGAAEARTGVALVRTARIVAALRGSDAADQPDVEIALALVVAARAGAVLSEETPPSPPPPAREQDGDEVSDGAREPDRPADDDPSSPPPTEPSTAEDPAGAERLVAAAEAWLPADVLAGLAEGRRRAGAGGGRRAARRPGGGGSGRGRTLRVARGRPGRGRRLHFLETLRAAAPHQGDRAHGEPVRIRSEDLRVRVVERRDPSTVVFTVDASGSQAVARLGEVKGAVELLLSDSYRRRDHVALVVFRGDSAKLALPPTRSLTRVRRAITGLPGGGGTPLAHGLATAARTGETEERMGRRPVIVLLTDGRPNVAMGEGRSGRAEARADALGAARSVASRGWPVLLVDSSRRPRPFTDELARALDARLIRLQGRNPESLKEAVATVSRFGSGRPVGG